MPDRVVPTAREVPIEALPSDTLIFLLGSRYCETDTLSQMAWDHFGKVKRFLPRLGKSSFSSTAMIVDFVVHDHAVGHLLGYPHLARELDIEPPAVGSCRGTGSAASCRDFRASGRDRASCRPRAS